MLAASTSHSPTIQYTASNNGTQSPSGSPRPCAPRQRPRAAGSPAFNPAKGAISSSRASYSDASTQGHSPKLTESSSTGLSARLEAVSAQAMPDNHQVEVPSTGAQQDVIPHSSSATLTALAPSTQPLSPSTKRQQVDEPVIASDSTTVAQPNTSKRPKSLKTPKILPTRYELCDVEDLVILIADMISELIETNDNLPLRDVELTRFHSRTAPGISVLDYLQRLAKHAALTPPLLLSMVYYIDRLCSFYPAFTITTLTVHRFLITAATVAAKGLSDSFWNNSTYARVGGIKLAELGLLELEFLYRVDWRIVPKPETLVEYYQGLVGRSDDYVLEHETEGAREDQEAPGPKQGIPSERNVPVRNNVTDSDWNKWMADNATAAKKGADTSKQ